MERCDFLPAHMYEVLSAVKIVPLFRLEKKKTKETFHPDNPTCPMSWCHPLRVTGGELFEDIVAREYYSEADARSVSALPYILCMRVLTHDLWS